MRMLLVMVVVWLKHKTCKTNKSSSLHRRMFFALLKREMLCACSSLIRHSVGNALYTKKKIARLSSFRKLLKTPDTNDYVETG